MLIDTHAHLNFKDFQKDQKEVISRAFQNGIDKIINIGCNLKSSQSSIKLAQEYPNIFAACGIHPEDASEATNENLITLENLIKNSSKIVAIGEIGLDYFHLKNSPEIQKQAFKKQLKLSLKLNLPVIVHCRSADEDCLRILKEEKIINCVFHCFSSDLKFAQKAWQEGYYTSFTGIVTYPNAKDIKAVAKNVPLDKFMIETDCPFLSPQAYRGQRNEPSYVTEIAREIARLKNLSFKQISDLSTKNAERFFHLPSVSK